MPTAKARPTFQSLLTFTNTGGALSRKIVQDGLDERQLRAVAMEIEARIRKLPKNLTSKDSQYRPSSKEISSAHNLSQQMGRTIVRALGLPDL